jgi:hypothetical protein
MNDKLPGSFVNLTDKFIGYLPDLLAGIVLLFIGWFLGWFAKRVIIQLAVILRLERFLIRFRWGRDFSKGDVRFGFYNFLGNIAFFIIFIIFVNNALSAWKLSVLSDLMERGILFLPRIIIALILFGIGWLISIWASQAILRALRREDIPRSTLIANFIKGVLLLFFSAMALLELNIAREIVIIGFATVFITLGIISVVLSVGGERNIFKKTPETIEEE